MDEGVYCVPNEVLFRNYSTAACPQTRNLLLQNKTNRVLNTIVSYPFSRSFRLHTPSEHSAELKPSPPHIVLSLQPYSTSKVVIELQIPDTSLDGSQRHLQDVIVVVFGGVRSLLVPVRAVHHGLDATAAAGGAAAAAKQQQRQQAALLGLAFWPPQQELDAQCSSFTEQVRAVYGLEVPDPTGPAPAGATGSAAATWRSDADGQRAAEPDISAGVGASACEDSLGNADVGASANGTQGADGSEPAWACPAQELPPEGFSQAQGAGTTGGVLLEENDGALQQPFVLHKSVKVQGRVAVAVPATAGPAGPSCTAGGGSAGGAPSAPAGSAASSAGRAEPESGQPLSDPLSRASSGSGAAGQGTRPGSSASVSASGVPSSGGGKLAFALNGKLYDARGNELDPLAERLAGCGPVTVVDCGEAATPRLSRSGSMTALTPPRMATPPSAAVGGAAAALAAAPFAGVPTSSPMASNPGPIALAPLRHGGVPLAQALRPGSASSPAAAAAVLGRPQRPSGAVVGSVGAAAAEDPMRQAALAAAMRELGITDLPTPSSTRGTSAMGTAGTGLSPSRAVMGLSGSGQAHPPATNPYLQYGLPPNYRPSSGRRQPPAATNPASPYDNAGGDDGDHDDADLEARLQQQIESNVLRSTGPGTGPGPAPAPRRTAAATGLATSSPGAYLPARAGAATSGGLGAPTAAAAAAAAVATGARLGKAAARMAGAGAGPERAAGPSASDNDYPEESEFELRLQRQIDIDVSNGGGATAGSGGAGRRSSSGTGGAGRTSAPGAGSGGGAAWRGSSPAAATSAKPPAAAPKPSGTTVGAAAAGPGAKRSTSVSSDGRSTGTAGAAGARRVSADSGSAGKVTVARSGSGARPAVPLATPQAAATASPQAGAVPRPGKPPGPASKPVGTVAAAAAGKADGVKAGAASAPDVQRMKANWDALG